MRGLGFEVNGNNNPSPENVPTAQRESMVENEQIQKSSAENYEGFCLRKATNMTNTDARLRGVTGDNISRTSFPSMFLMCMPMSYIKEVLLVETNKKSKGRH